MSQLLEAILTARGLLDPAARDAFLNPSYEAMRHDPFLLPDMEKAVERLVVPARGLPRAAGSRVQAFARCCRSRSRSSQPRWQN